MEAETRSLKRDELLTRAKEASASPGVYLMKSQEDQVLYVGKAKALRNRLTSYFQAPVHEIPRIELLVLRVDHFDLIVTETESEALILESTLIKKYKPKFNIRLKDDKAYPYLKIRGDQEFPRLEWSRRVLKDGARYFGPFPSAGSARQVMRLLIEAFKLRDCSDNTFSHRSRPCLLYQMGRCAAPCVQKISSLDYRESVNEVVRVLEGKSSRLIDQLKSSMATAAEGEDFEEAAFLRDQIQSLELVTQVQGVVEAGSDKHRDILGIARGSGAEGPHATVLRVRHGKVVSVQHFSLQNSDPSDSDADLLAQLISQNYLHYQVGKKALLGGKLDPAQLVEQEQEGESSLLRPQEIWVSQPPSDVTALEKALGISILTPEESQSLEKRLLQQAESNAKLALDQRKRGTGGHGAQALEEVQSKLHLSHFPRRIECYDISNIQGQDPVASRVVFIEGAPDKNLYRRYKIKTVVGSNDFAMMKEVLGRRFSNPEEDLPDLVVVDGGKGQLSQAVAIMEELSVQGVGVVGLAKARTESDFQAVEVKSSHERIFIPNRKNPVPLLPHTQAYKLLTHIRDEAHRFAISYHRLLRDKRSLKTGG